MLDVSKIILGDCHLELRKLIATKEAEARKQLLDSLIDEEIKLYNIYRDPTISVGIKIMADAVREKYDEI